MEETGRRQQAGFACEECRRRKARCDRVRPKCGYCLETDADCIVIDKTIQRGPKKGHMTALRSRIETLQWQLSQQGGSTTNNSDAIPAQTVPGWDLNGGQAPREIEMESGNFDFSSLEEDNLSNICFPSTAMATKPAAPVDIGQSFWSTGMHIDNHGLAMTAIPTEVQSMPSDLYVSDQSQSLSHSTEPISPVDNRDTAMTDLMRADLDQVFFDRVHPVLPIIYHRRYFSWADKEHPGAMRACLRSAMRAMAAAMSAPGRRFCDQLYAETCDLLEAHKIDSKADISIEYVQAWLLLAHYELLRVGEYQAMLTAGRCLRLVLMARLSDLDSPGPDGVTYPLASPVFTNRENVREDSFSLVEEQRRVFWLSFCLDRSLCLRNEYPLTLQEDTICVRLPAPEANFQNNQSIRTTFLPEAMSAPQNTPPLSSFAECILAVTLHGHCLALQRSPTSPSPATNPADTNPPFWPQRKRLAHAVDTRLRVLGTLHGSGSGPLDSDPMLLFAHMLAHSAVIRLGHAAQRCSSSSLAGWRSVDEKSTLASYRNRALSAATEMVHLARQLPSFSVAVRAHPFLPDPIGCAVGYLTNPTNNTTAATAAAAKGTETMAETASNEDGIQDLLRLLRAMQDKNGLASAYLDGSTRRDSGLGGLWERDWQNAA